MRQIAVRCFELVSIIRHCRNLGNLRCSAGATSLICRRFYRHAGSRVIPIHEHVRELPGIRGKIERLQQLSISTFLREFWRLVIPAAIVEPQGGVSTQDLTLQARSRPPAGDSHGYLGKYILIDLLYDSRREI